MVSMMLFGRVWCGVFCPEGALTEFASHHGLGRPIPRWMRWSGWPFTAFVCTTVYGQLVSVYEYPQAALLVLGGSSVAAVAVGFVYGRAAGLVPLLNRQRRVLVAGEDFALASRSTRRRGNAGRPLMVDCAPPIDIRHMKSASACHSCGCCAVIAAWCNSRACRAARYWPAQQERQHRGGLTWSTADRRNTAASSGRPAPGSCG